MAAIDAAGSTAKTSTPPSVCYHDIAGQHDADVGLHLQGLVSHDRVAGPEDAVGTEVLSDLGLQRRLDVDLGQHAEAVSLESSARAIKDGVEIALDGAGMEIGHGVWSLGSGATDVAGRLSRAKRAWWGIVHPSAIDPLKTPVPG